MTDQEEHHESTEHEGLRINQFSLMALMGVTTLCAVGAAIGARLGGVMVCPIALNVPLIVFGTFCIWDSVVHRRKGWFVGVFVGNGMALHGIILTVYPLLMIPRR